MRVLATLLLVAASGCGGTPPCGPASGTVAVAIDGDTITLQSGEKIRYLLINAPEITNGHDECYGAEARDFNRALVEGQPVELSYDEAQCKDRFGRLLAYVKVSGHEVNKLLVDRGFACVLHIPPAGDSRAAEFQAAQSSARANGAGVWGYCSPVPCL